MKKKLTLIEAWRNCIEQWEYVHEKLKRARTSSVGDFKEQWLKDHDFAEDTIDSHCFFCEYAEQHGGGNGDGCTACPGKKIDPSFTCLHTDYHYAYCSDEFYNKLQELYKIRRSKRKCQRK